MNQSSRTTIAWLCSRPRWLWLSLLVVAFTASSLVTTRYCYLRYNVIETKEYPIDDLTLLNPRLGSLNDRINSLRDLDYEITPILWPSRGRMTTRFIQVTDWLLRTTRLAPNSNKFTKYNAGNSRHFQLIISCNAVEHEQIAKLLDEKRREAGLPPGPAPKPLKSSSK